MLLLFGLLLLLFVVVGGRTGSGKTEVLRALALLDGGAVIDLEGLANHRGSAFGGLGLGPQPSQIEFEHSLHEVTHSRTHALTHSRTRAPAHSLTHVLSHSPRTSSLAPSLPPSLTPSVCTHLSTPSLAPCPHSLTYSLFRSLLRSLLHPSPHSLTPACTRIPPPPPPCGSFGCALPPLVVHVGLPSILVRVAANLVLNSALFFFFFFWPVVFSFPTRFVSSQMASPSLRIVF